MDDATNPGHGDGSHSEAGPEGNDLSAILMDVRAWRQEADDAHAKQLREVDDEVARLREAIENLQRELTALSGFRDELATRRRTVAREQSQRAHERIFDVLGRQSTALEERAFAAAEAELNRMAKIEETIRSSEKGTLFSEYEKFAANLPSLAALPASYRDVLTSHHQAQGEQLRAWVYELDAGPAQIEAEPLKLDIVYTVDQVEGEPELVSIVVPVDETVYSNWRDRTEDIQLSLAARVVQALYETAHALGMARSHAMYGGHRGLLAVELEFPRGHDKDLSGLIQASLDAILSSAPELNAARITARAAMVPVDFLLPPAETAEEIDDVD